MIPVVFYTGIALTLLGIGDLVTVKSPLLVVTGGLGSVIAILGLML